MVKVKIHFKVSYFDKDVSSLQSWNKGETAGALGPDTVLLQYVQVGHTGSFNHSLLPLPRWGLQSLPFT